MRVYNGDKSTARVVHSLIETHHLVLAELFVIEFSILIILCILHVKPKDINWEAISAEVMIALQHLVSIGLLILGKIVSKGVDWWQWSISCQL